MLYMYIVCNHVGQYISPLYVKQRIFGIFNGGLQDKVHHLPSNH